jgi:ABC-type glycerol-3-phosphate transport system substrate-binding protein
MIALASLSESARKIALGGLDKAAKLFEQAYPSVKVQSTMSGGGPAEYQKLQTAIKAGSGGPEHLELSLSPASP